MSDDTPDAGVLDSAASASDSNCGSGAVGSTTASCPMDAGVPPAAGVPPLPGHLKITVRNNWGELLENAEVELLGREYRPASKTPASGVVNFRDLTTGDGYTVHVTHSGCDGPLDTDATVVTDTTTDVSVVLQTPKITRVDDHFAPAAETLNITYRIGGLTRRTVKLSITGDNYTGSVLFERELTAAEKADGKDKVLTWDGQCDRGPRNRGFATPLLGPFKAKLLVDNRVADESPFKILYHSIVLDFGKHTPDGVLPPIAQKEKYAQARLNDLGYDAGPVTGVIGPTTEKAIRRFQRANYTAGTTALLTENGTLDADTLAALQRANPREIWETGKTPLTQASKFFVYDNFNADRNENLVTGTGTEFNSQDRDRYAESKMERPFIPLEVEVKLLNKSNGGASVPGAVGPVTVAWEIQDPAEDEIISAASNGKARTYVQRARRFGATARITGAARIDQTGDNTEQAFKGFRSKTPATNIASWFPKDAGSVLSPYSVRDYGTEVRSGTTYNRALVNAWDHATDHPRCKGRAGVYFRFSTKGGDNAKIRVSLTFAGLPNRVQLESDHKPYTANLTKETGQWTVWRRARISAYCKQAAPSRPSGNVNWGTIRDRWREAFIELENGGNPLQIFTYTTVVTEAKYKRAIFALPAARRPAGISAAHPPVYRPASMYGGRQLTQAAGETAQQFVNRVAAASRQWADLKVANNALNAILAILHQEARKTSPEGFVIFDFRLHDPVSGQDWDPTLNGGRGGWKATANPAAQNVTSGAIGYVHFDGAVTMCVDNNFNINCYLCHECGHARFLYHHKTQNHGASPSDNPTHHDADQDRCTMSYDIAPDTPDQWRYPYCGKCILRLRGWDVLALPNQYTT